MGGAAHHTAQPVGEVERAPRAAADLAARGWELETVMTGNGSEFRSRVFGETVAELGARQRFIHAGRPQTNGCVERVQGTILEECWKPSFARHLIPKQNGLRRDLVRYLDYYNADRAHSPMCRQIPVSGQPGVPLNEQQMRPGSKDTDRLRYLVRRLRS